MTDREAAEQVGIEYATYRDIEAYDDEVFMMISVRHVVKLLQVLRLDVTRLFDQVHREAEPDPLLALASRIKNWLGAHAMSVPAFEDAVGWSVANALRDPEQFQDFNLDGLRDVTSYIGVNWADVLWSLEQVEARSTGG